MTGTLNVPPGFGAGIVVTVLKNGAAVGTAPSDADGNWSLSIVGARDGDVFAAAADVPSFSDALIAKFDVPVGALRLGEASLLVDTSFLVLT